MKKGKNKKGSKARFTCGSLLIDVHKKVKPGVVVRVKCPVCGKKHSVTTVCRAS